MAEPIVAPAAEACQEGTASPGVGTETTLPLPTARRYGNAGQTHDAICADCGTAFIAHGAVTRCRPCLLKQVGLPAHYQVSAWAEMPDLTPEERRRFDALWQQEASRPRASGAYEGMVLREPRRRHE